MVTNASNVRVAITGEWFYADESDHIPTVTDGELSAIPEEFIGLGYFSSDGFSITRDVSTTPINAWQNSDEVRTLKTDVSQRITLNPIETTRAVLELVRNAVMTADGRISAKPGASVRRTLIGNVTDGNKVWRIWIPSAEITSWESEEYSSQSEVSYSHELTTYSKVIGGVEYGPIEEFYPFLAEEDEEPEE